MKECRLCGETMRLITPDLRSSAVGPEGREEVRQVREWVCPECEYFEEAEAGER
jgi:hypothetical protein